MVWDPMCGSGYLLTVLGLLHRPEIAGLIASDIDSRALEITRLNLGLLTETGLLRRRAELSVLADRFEKPSHQQALAAADRLGAILSPQGGDLQTSVAHADVFDVAALSSVLVRQVPDVVVTDIPYGEQVDWQGAGGAQRMLEALWSVLPEATIIAVTGRRRTDFGRFRPVESFRIGTRGTSFFRVG